MDGMLFEVGCAFHFDLSTIPSVWNPWLNEAQLVYCELVK